MFSRILILFGFVLASIIGVRTAFAQASQEMRWNGLLVKQERVENLDDHPLPFPEFIRLTVTRIADGKIVYSENFNFSVDLRIFRTPFQSYVTITGFSGGESGCCTFIEALYERYGELATIYVVDVPGYIQPTIVDLDKDGTDEVRSESESFYDYALASANSRPCTTHLTQPSYVGMSDIRLPTYKTLESKADGSLQIKDITFSSNLRDALNQEIEEVEKQLKGLRRDIIVPDEPELAPILQYLQYKTQLGARSAAISFLKELDISVRYQCMEGADEQRTEDLLSVIDGDWKPVVITD